jgi:release factor glutamine methyltransferase
MTTQYWLDTATKFLESKSIASARLDCLVLLEDTLKIDRAKILAEPDREMKDSAVAHLQNLLSRRARHEPLAYVRGHTEFYGRTFVITPAVLEPRPESETMIDLLKQLCHPQLDWGSRQKSSALSGLDPRLREADTYIADVGTGSGALGITAKLELPETQVDLLEIDSKVLKVAKTNVDLFTLNISTIQSDLLASSSQDYDILLCNLPYVPDSHTINQAALHEPKLAIFGGPDGLDLYRKLFKQAEKRLVQPLYILTESLPPQHAALKQIAGDHGYELLTTDDFIQVFRPR